MSLEYAAEAVRSKGRGDDTMLVHMTPGEVKGLQQLAMAYGGSLSTNPETGLPEAGFLKSLLPTLIGAGLMMVPGMQGVGAGFLGGTAGMIGMGVGALEYARTGDLGKGLLAGLGAYGGAGLTGAAQAAGAAAGQQAATQGAEAAIYDQALGGAAVAPPAYTAPTTFMGNVAEAGRGAGALVSSGGYGDVARTAAMESLGGGTGLATSAGAALIEPLTAPAPMPEVEEVEYNYDGPYKPTERKVRYPGPDRDPTDSSEFQYFDVVNPSPGFEPMASSTPLPENTYGPDAPRFAGIPVEIATDPERMRDYQQNPDLYSFAEGGGAKIAPTSYVAGRDAEFDYGFQPMANVPSTQPVQGQMQTQGVSGLPGYKTQSLADLQAQGKIGRGTGFAGTNLTGQQHQSSIINHFLNHPQIGPQLRADGYYAEGGPTVTAPPSGYVAGQDAEFNYGFSQMPTDMPVVQETARASRGIASVQDPVAQKITVAVNNSGGGGDDYRAPNPNTTYNFNQAPSQSVSTPSRDFAAEQAERAAAAAAIAAQQSDTRDDSFESSSSYGYDYAMGGEVDMHNNGFVVDAHTVSEFGNGSSNAGMERFAQIGGQPIMGPGDGTSDSIPANIDGMQPAMVARDEVYMPPDAVAMYGGGSLKIGEKKLYALMEQARKSRKKNGRGQSTGLKQLVA